jgi:N-hydroxyarylamine O-acetyltransferase
MVPDLDAYFARIGHAGNRDPSLATLRALHARHPVAIPFENLDVIRGTGVRLDAASIEQKLVTDRRGGYCFEHNLLFASVLRALGFQVTTLTARVRWQVPPDVVTPRAHMVLRVDLDDVPWLVDVGFGGLTPTAPVRLDRLDPQTTPHEVLRVTRAGDGHVLQANVAGGWGDVYQIAMEAQHPVDFELANWYTSTHPTSRFTQNLIVTRACDDGRRLSLLNRELVERSRDDVHRRAIDTPDELLDVLASRFGLRFPAGTRFGSPGTPWPA